VDGGRHIHQQPPCENQQRAPSNACIRHQPHASPRRQRREPRPLAATGDKGFGYHAAPRLGARQAIGRSTCASIRYHARTPRSCTITMTACASGGVPAVSSGARSPRHANLMSVRASSCTASPHQWCYGVPVISAESLPGLQEL
jgi:hypothetical protein